MWKHLQLDQPRTGQGTQQVTLSIIINQLKFLRQGYSTASFICNWSVVAALFGGQAANFC